MPSYRTAVAVTFVKDGKVVSVDANRVISDLADDQAKKLGDKVIRIDETAPSMFPTGAPVIFHGQAPEQSVAEVDAKDLVSGLPQPKKAPSVSK